jgi:hypothetical protein
MVAVNPNPAVYNQAIRDRANELPAPRTIAASKADVLSNLAFFFGDPVVPERLRDYSEHRESPPALLVPSAYFVCFCSRSALCCADAMTFHFPDACELLPLQRATQTATQTATHGACPCCAQTTARTPVSRPSCTLLSLC